MSALIGAGLELAERGLVPLPLLRRAIRGLCRDRLEQAAESGGVDAFLARLEGTPIAVATEEANAQHYELPSDFFRLVLGPNLKYSSAFFPAGVTTLAAAEEAMLALTAERAGLADGQSILELGSGWGSLSLWMARHYPAARILSVSNSVTQRAFIEAQGLPNLRVRTADINDFEPGETFDRVVSVEMFEHLRDWRTLLDRIDRWLVPEGQLFVHVFCHIREAYPFDTEGDDDWMGRHFFTGGVMPSFDLLPRVAGTFLVDDQWWVDGVHYQRTAAAWRENLEARRGEVLRVLERHYGDEAGRWYQRWRMFFLACEELFGFRRGEEWGVGHYRLCKEAGSTAVGRGRTFR